MLWLCIRLPRLAHEALAAVAQRAASTADCSTGHAVMERAAVERAAIERLAGWAYQWTSLVSYHLADEPLLWLELGASRALFGGHAALLAQLEAGLTLLGYSHVCALAPSPSGAALLTHVDAPVGTRTPPQRCAFTLPQLRARLEPLPLSLLALPEAILSALQSAGLRCIGQVLALPAAAIARRFGPETSLYLQRLCGAASDPRPAWRAPAAYRARCEFGGEVHDTNALLFPLQRLLLEFQGYLRGRDCSVLHFTLEFEHRRHPAGSVTIGLSAPARDAAQFLLLARERLQRTLLEAPVSALILQALEFTSPAIVQADLFGSDAQRLQQLQLLLDRLRARLGESRIQGLQSRADYRPERAWDCVAPRHGHRPPRESGESGEIAGAGAPAMLPMRPCALLPAPRRIEAAPELLSGPERIESGWWDDGDAARDYYVARGADGARLWVFHDLRHGGWYLQGLWV